MTANRHKAASKIAVGLVGLMSALVVVCLLVLFLYSSPPTHRISSALASESAPRTEPADPNQPDQKQDSAQKAPRPSHDHPAFEQRQKQRLQMVENDIRRPSFAEPVTDPNVLYALKTVPRHAFVPETYSGHAYEDRPLPIGHGQTISQPYIVAFMTRTLNLDASSKVLEIGTGSGYQAAVCAETARRVFTIEIIEPLAESARKRLKKLGYHNVSVKAGDGYFGWPEHAPFDAIIVTAAAGYVPPPLVRQLKPGGKMILPIGSPYTVQPLVLITKDKQGQIKSKSLMPVRFVPMLGEVTRSRPDSETR